MEKRSISTKKAPEAIGPYSQGIIIGDLVFLSGQIGVDPETGKMVEGGVLNQARQIFANINNVLEEAGCLIDDIIKATVFLKSMDDFKNVNTIYSEIFSLPYPARSAIEVAGLPLNADIEIEVIAKKT
ncbi:MAG: RidA family protein [Acidobacteriota bacterium]